MTKKERERRKENSFYNSELAQLQKNVVRAQYDVLFYKNGRTAADKIFFITHGGIVTEDWIIGKHIGRIDLKYGKCN
ncbi:hypothetical protein [uncultured Treponema sp.]|uniref:hypothetical protein n=1 Tax=uncultured Treponema sp. TaxID=162155 RepID=UPI0025871BC1|nr:hypothetical protein [uncultured Treponema sp.]